MDPEAEAQRLQRLHDIGILDTPEDRLFRGFVEQALEIIPGASIAAVSLIDSDRQWFKTIIGLDVKQTPRDVAFCSHTIQSQGLMVVEDATQDSRFADNPLVTSAPNIRFYAGIKLIDGVGALCVIGRQPRRLAETEMMKLSRLAHFVEIQLLAHGIQHNLKASRAG
jgi:GAF domain-containing protein